MPLPDHIRVKLSSEAAGSISLTPVVVREMPLRELVEEMLALTGKDERRLLEILRRGTLVSGASRFRWTGWEVAPSDLHEILGSFPDADPARAFNPDHCTRVILAGDRVRIELTREAATKTGLLQRTTFWSVVTDELAQLTPAYVEYSYRAKADVYRAALPPQSTQRLRAKADLLRYTSLRDQILRAPLASIDLYVAR